MKEAPEADSLKVSQYKKTCRYHSFAVKNCEVVNAACVPFDFFPAPPCLLADVTKLRHDGFMPEAKSVQWRKERGNSGKIFSPYFTEQLPVSP